MMCFEVFLKIAVAVFAVFGVYSLAFFVRETWFGSDNITVAIEVDTGEVVSDLETYLREAHSCPLSHGDRITVLIRRDFATEELLRKLKRKHIKYYVLDMENKAD